MSTLIVVSWMKTAEIVAQLLVEELAAVELPVLVVEAAEVVTLHELECASARKPSHSQKA